jgi:hypothetical protein
MESLQTVVTGLMPDALAVAVAFATIILTIGLIRRVSRG